MTIVLRNVKDSPLTHSELDGNFTDLNSRVITIEATDEILGVSWTSQTNPVDNNWKSVTYGNGLFVAIAQTGTGNRVMTSPDGVNWTIRTSAADVSWQSVAYGDGVFVVVANVGGTRVMTSYDGITWTLRTPPLSSSWSSIVYGNGLFVAVSSQNTTSGCMSSPDGITWTGQTLPVARVWNAVTYGNGLYVAVGETGTGDRVMTSPDAVTWTSRTSAADNSWNGIVYGNGMFVAVSSIDVDYGVMSSPDGITWTIRVTSLNTEWNNVTWGNGVFVAVGRDTAGGGTDNVMTSPDGINWTIRTGAAANTWNDVVYGNGLFVAISGDGTSNRVMTSGYQEVIVVDDAHRVNGPLGINTIPDGTMHVQTATAGTVTASASADELIVENSANTGISILSPNANSSNLYFGSPSANFGAFYTWNPTANLASIGASAPSSSLELKSGNVTAIRIAFNQEVCIGDLTNPDGTLHVHTATAGAVTANNLADDLIVENSTNGGISVLTPDASTGVIAIGSPSDEFAAYYNWNYSGLAASLGTATANAKLDFYSGNDVLGMTLDASQNLGVGIGTSDGKCHVHTGSAGTVTAHIDANEIIAENSANSGISILAPDAANSSIYFGSPTDNLGALLQWNYNGGVLSAGTSKAGASINFLSGASSTAMTIASDQGAFMVGATGGSQGSGTFNATAVYDDGVLLTCYVPHYIVDGKIDLSEWDGFVPNKEELKTFHEPARRFVDDIDNRIDVTKFTDFWKTKKHLPTMPSKEEWIEDGPLPTGKMVQKLWETVELQAAHIDQLLTRIEALEGAK